MHSIRFNNPTDNSCAQCPCQPIWPHWLCVPLCQSSLTYVTLPPLLSFAMHIRHISLVWWGSSARPPAHGLEHAMGMLVPGEQERLIPANDGLLQPWSNQHMALTTACKLTVTLEFIYLPQCPSSNVSRWSIAICQSTFLFFQKIYYLYSSKIIDKIVSKILPMVW